MAGFTFFRNISRADSSVFSVGRLNANRTVVAERRPIFNKQEEAADTCLLSMNGVGLVLEDNRTGQKSELVRDVNLDVARGEFVSIIGLQGNEGSTFLESIAGLTKLNAGSIQVDGHIVTGPGSGKAVLLKQAALFPWRTVLQNIVYDLELQGVPWFESTERARQYIELVQLDGYEHFHPGALSGGMQQRVNLARVLVADPALLLLDDPFANLDTVSREILQNELLWVLSKTRKTVLMETKDVEEAVLLSDRVVILGNNPATIVGEVKIDLPKPRTITSRNNPRFGDLVEEIKSRISQSDKEVIALSA